MNSMESAAALAKQPDQSKKGGKLGGEAILQLLKDASSHAQHLRGEILSLRLAKVGGQSS